MRLAPCPDCRKMISLAATACPHCGRPITEGELAPPTPKPMSRGCTILMIIAAVLVVILLLKAMETGSKIREDDERLRQRILDNERRRSN